MLSPTCIWPYLCFLQFIPFLCGSFVTPPHLKRYMKKQAFRNREQIACYKS